MSARTIFGAAALSHATQEEADRALETLDAFGIDHIDVAASYGDAELRVAPWIARRGRDAFFIATKTGERTYEGARDEIRRSLERLGVARIDLIQLHNLVGEEEWEAAFSHDGALRAAIEARDEGLVRFIGVTGHGVHAPARHRKSLDRFPFDSVLFPYNFTQMRDPTYAAAAEDLMRVCETRGVAIQPIKAIAHGPWHGDRPAKPTTWYEPLIEQADIDLAVRWVLARPGVFLNTVADLDLLPKVLEAADRGGSKPSDDEMTDLVDRLSMTPFFA